MISCDFKKPQLASESRYLGPMNLGFHEVKYFFATLPCTLDYHKTIGDQFLHKSITQIKYILASMNDKVEILDGPMKIIEYCHFQMTCKDLPISTNQKPLKGDKHHYVTRLQK